MKRGLMRHEKKLWWAGIVISWLFAGASTVDAYTYTRGPNYVNMSGSRCRPDTTSDALNLSYGAGSVTVLGTVPTLQLFCPIQRRNTSFYGDTSGSNFDIKVGGDYISVSAADGSTADALSCYPFASGMGNGASFFGSSRYLCGTDGGCDSVSASFTGRGTISIPNPYGFAGVQTVNWGLVCTVPVSSTVYYIESSIWPVETF